MKKICAFATAVTLILSAATTLCACKQQTKDSLNENFFAMGTLGRLVVDGVSQDKFEELSAEVGDMLTAVENSLSASRIDSCIYNFNTAAAGATVQIDQTCYNALSLAKQVYELTGGYFNPAMWYSSDLYGFATRPAGAPAMPYDRQNVTEQLPDEKYVTAFHTLSEHFSEVEISQSYGIYYATKPSFTVEVDGAAYSLALDLGGIAKGMAVDKVNEIFAKYGVEYGYFNFGESSYSVKKFNGGDGNYTVKADDPRGVGYYASFKMQNVNLSTSGDNRNYYTVDGTRYCHIIDPTTGSPIRTGVASVTVVGGQAGLSDALTTALAAMGSEKAVRFINENLTDCKVIMLVFEDDKDKVITNAPEYFRIEKGNYKLANTVEDGKIILN